MLVLEELAENLKIIEYNKNFVKDILKKEKKK